MTVTGDEITLLDAQGSKTMMQQATGIRAPWSA